MTGEMKERASSAIATIVAILSLAGLEALALHKEVDGTLFVPVVAAIAGLGGFKVRDIFKNRQ